MVHEFQRNGTGAASCAINESGVMPISSLAGLSLDPITQARAAPWRRQFRVSLSRRDRPLMCCLF
jgi:hypothetical protein